MYPFGSWNFLNFLNRFCFVIVVLFLGVNSTISRGVLLESEHPPKHHLGYYENLRPFVGKTNFCGCRNPYSFCYLRTALLNGAKPVICNICR